MVCNEESQQCECREATQWSNKWDINKRVILDYVEL